MLLTLVVQLTGFDHLIRPFQVPHEAFVAASKALKRQITPAVLQKFEKWKGTL
jgi:hypothetical protein